MAWKEEEHPRDDDGKFTDGTGSKSGTILPGKYQNADNAEKDFQLNQLDGEINCSEVFNLTAKIPTVYLSKSEYAHVMSEIATNIPKNQANQPIIRKAIGNFYYIFENRGFGEYRIISKTPILDEEES